MSFSAKDKKILIFLGVFIASVLLWKLFLDPQFKLILKLKSELKTVKNEYISNIAYGEKLKGVDSELKIINQRLKDLRTKYPPVMNYDEVFIIIKNMAKSSGLSINSLNFSSITQLSSSDSKGTAKKKATASTGAGNDVGASPSPTKEEETGDNKKISDFLTASGLGDSSSGEGIENSAIPDGKGYEITVKIAANGTIKQIKDFFYLVENLKSKYSYRDFQISMGDKGILNFNVTVGFIGIADKKAGKYTMLETGEWVPLNAVGKTDIFNPYEGYMGAYFPDTSNSAGNTKTNLNDILSQLQAYDFTMRVLPFGESIAMPTVSLLAKKVVFDDKDTIMPIVYGDSEGEEKVDLYLEEKDGKMFCKFRTGHEAFPDRSYSRLVEFTPVGNDLKMLIDSTVRKYKNDNSTVRINITNKTKRNLIIKVSNDDANKPRVIIPKSEKVKVEYS